MKILDVVFYCVSAIAIVALPFLIVNWIRLLKRRAVNKFNPTLFSGGFPVKSVMFFVVPIFAAIGIAEFMASSSRAEALNFIRGSAGNYTVYVNQQIVLGADKVISALKTVSPKLAHHSHPTKRIRVELNSEKGHMTLELARDSDYPQEYWVFYPKYRVTANNEIGRITTSVFDQY
jgi:hypothetical protein